MRQPHPEINFRQGRGRRTTGKGLLAALGAVGMSNDEKRAFLEKIVSEQRLKRIEQLMEADPPKDSPEGIELDRLADEQAEYERRIYPEFSKLPLKFANQAELARAREIVSKVIIPPAKDE